MGVEQELVRHLVECRFEDIPPATVEKQKTLFVDTLGVAVGGVRASGVDAMLGVITEAGGRPESTLVGRKDKVPSFLAAMGNTFMAHALDFDDMHEEAGIHANVCVIPAALAVAEKMGGINGNALLTAVVCGVDLACRMGVSIPLLRGWHATTTFGVFGAAAAAYKILGLDETRTASALGIAYSQAAGNRQGRLEGTLTKRIQVALAVKSGVLAALLAQKGLTGPARFNQASRVAIKASSGNYVATSGTSKGHPENPLTGDELFSKFLECFRFGLPELAATGRVRAIFDTLMNLEKVEDAGQITRLLICEG